MKKIIAVYRYAKPKKSCCSDCLGYFHDIPCSSWRYDNDCNDELNRVIFEKSFWTEYEYASEEDDENIKIISCQVDINIKTIFEEYMEKFDVIIDKNQKINVCASSRLRNFSS